MSELTVNLNYRHPLTTTLAVLARLSFPLWALIMPLVAVASGFVLICGLGAGKHFGLQVTHAFEVMMASIAVMSIGIRLNKLVEPVSNYRMHLAPHLVALTSHGNRSTKSKQT
jgi:hypothetical protein